MPMAMPAKMISAHIRRVSLGRWCATRDASVYPVERKSAGAADADLEASPRLGAAPLAPLRSAFRALASDRLEKELEILLPIVVGDLVARLDRLDRAQDDLAAHDVGFGVGTAGVIGVTRDVAAGRAVHGPAAVDLVEVARPARLEPRRLRGADAAPLVLDDEGALRDLRGGEQSEPGRAAPDAVGLARAIEPLRHRSGRPFRTRARHLEPRLHRHGLAQGGEARTALGCQALDLTQLIPRCVARDADLDRDLLEARAGRVRHHVAAHVEIAARHRLEAVVRHAELGRIEGEHRGVAADCAGEQKFERRRCAILPAHVHRLADDEFVAALPAVDELVELADRRYLDLDEALRSFRRRLVGMRAVAALARVGDLFELGKAVADLGHADPRYFTSTRPIWLTRLLAVTGLPSRSTSMLRTMSPPPGIAQLWNVSVFGSKRTMVLGLTPDSLYQSAPRAKTMP